MDALVKNRVSFELTTAKKYLNKTLFLFENNDDCIKVIKSSRKAQGALGNARKIMLEALNGNQEFNKIIQLLRN